MTDDVDVRLALRAIDRFEHVAAANRAGYVRAADVHVATRLACLAGEEREPVVLALALLVRVVRDGSTCLDLALARSLAPEVLEQDDDASDVTGVQPSAPTGSALTDAWPDPRDWLAAVQASPLVAAGVLRVEGGLLYLARYADQERSVRDDLLTRLSAPAPELDPDVLDASLARVFPDAGYAEQRAAARELAAALTGVLTGGPGSGKTTTVAGFLVALADQSEERLRIALTAPTGKAAARLQEAVAAAAEGFEDRDRQRLADLEASTLHRLLGWRRGSRTRFRHDRGNTLPHDVVVVDESSMLSLTLTARLLEALRPDARLVLVGDADQLASVDAGAVLGDLVSGLADRPGAAIVTLTGSHRYGGAIGDLARAVRAGDAETVLAVLRGGEGMRFVEEDDPAPLVRPRLLAHAVALREAARAGDADGALAVVGEHRLLCAHRSGPFGVRVWNRRVENWLVEHTGDGLYEAMYPGRPLLVTANDYGLRLFNGDTGVVLSPQEPGAPPPAVLAGAGGQVRLSATRLADVETMHAMTVHKSQGSEALDVTVILPPGDSPLLTRELLYTAVTRARRSVTLVGSQESVRAALERRARRATGLAARLLL